MNYARKKFNLADYLPKFRMPYRPWVCNLSKDFHFQDLVFTKLGTDFKTWVDDKMKEREIFLINKHSFTINILPEFAEGFAKLKRVSSKLHYLSLCILFSCKWWSNRSSISFSKVPLMIPNNQIFGSCSDFQLLLFGFP